MTRMGSDPSVLSVKSVVKKKSARRQENYRAKGAWYYGRGYFAHGYVPSARRRLPSERTEWLRFERTAHSAPHMPFFTKAMSLFESLIRIVFWPCESLPM